MSLTYAYLFGPQPAPSGAVAGVLADVDARFVPGVLALLETKKTAAAWNEGDYTDGYTAYTRLQWGLLMDASNRIISEIRQVRGPKPGQDITETFDPDVTPIYNGTSLFDVLYNSASGLEGVNEKLQLLVDDMSEEDRAAILAQLTRIAVAIAGAPV